MVTRAIPNAQLLSRGRDEEIDYVAQQRLIARATRVTAEATAFGEKRLDALNKAQEENVRQSGRQIRAIRGLGLTFLGVSAASLLFSGGLSDATQGGLALSSAAYGLTASLYGLQDALARALTPALETIVPWLNTAIDKYVELDDAAGGWITRGALIAAGIWAAGRALLGLGRFAGDIINNLRVVYRWLRTRIPQAVGVTRAALSGLGTWLATRFPALVGIGSAALRGLVPAGALLAVVQYREQIGGLVEDLLGLPNVDELIRQKLGVNPQRNREILDNILRFEIPGLDRLFGQGGQPQPAPAPAPGANVPRLAPNQAPQTVNFFLTSYDDNEMMRRLQAMYDQGAFDLSGSLP